MHTHIEILTLSARLGLTMRALQAEAECALGRPVTLSAKLVPDELERLCRHLRNLQLPVAQ